MVQDNRGTGNGASGVSLNAKDVQNPSLAMTAEIRSEIPEEFGWSKRKRVPRKLEDALNGCLCGLVLDRSSNGVLMCKQAGCETQWVSSTDDVNNNV